MSRDHLGPAPELARLHEQFANVGALLEVAWAKSYPMRRRRLTPRDSAVTNSIRAPSGRPAQRERNPLTGLPRFRRSGRLICVS